MTVEIINHNPNEVLDLTGEEENVDEGIVQETGEVAVQEETAEGGGDSDGSGSGDDDSSSVNEPPDSVEEEKEGSEDEPSDETEYYFGDQQVVVEVPDEISTALEEAGIDKSELLGQLFKKDGDFTLDEDTKSKLDEKFGKTLVDGYLNMYKGMNEQTLSKLSADKEAQAAVEEKQGQAYAEAVGGEEGLVVMEDYILNNFDESQIAAYNSVMENGDHESQLLIISQVKQLQAMSDKLANGDSKVDLVGDKDAANNSVSSPLDKGFITNAEYNELMNDDKYWTDKAYMNKVDAARMAGFKHDA